MHDTAVIQLKIFPPFRPEKVSYGSEEKIVFKAE
jgi:hypothetical protein